MNTETLTEQIQAIIAQGMAGRIPAHFTAKRVMALIGQATEYDKYDLGDGDICPDCQNAVVWSESRAVWLHLDPVSGCYLALTNQGMK